MSEIKNETFNIGDRFRGLVNGDIFVVEALPKKGDEVRTPVSYTHLTLPTICSV